MTAADRLVSDYLDRLESELSGLPRQSRREVIDEVEAHIAEARTALAPEDELGVRNVLERLGDPAEIAAEAEDRFGVRRKQTTWREVAALILLPFGFVILPVVGWFAGVILLWSSEAWNTRDKLIGTFVLPGGMFGPFLLFFVAGSAETCATPPSGQTTCSGGGMPVWLGAPLAILLLVAPLVTAGYLLWRLKKSPA
jgi:uncharacterized membrane protein